MESLFAFFTLLSLLLFANTVAARKDPAGDYWRTVMNDEPMPEAIQGLIRLNQVQSLSNEKTVDCHEEKTFVKDTEPRPNISAYPDDIKDEKSVVKDFEPRPNVSVYHDDIKPTDQKSVVKDFEPRPNVSVYHDDKEDKLFVKDFEPRPDATVYQG